MMEKSNLLYLYTYVYELFILSILFIIIGIYLSSSKIILPSALFIIILLFFYRNLYEHKREENNNVFCSPASNKITKINYTNTDTVISSYLSPFDRHFMIAPCKCTVIEKIYKPQRETDSECMRHICKDVNGNTFYMDQIVSKPLHWGWIPSILYKRCVSFVSVGQELEQGERFGLIRFGSNMEYSVPNEYRVDPSIIHTKIDMGQIIGKK